MMVKHMGREPSKLQREIIRRCARLALHLELQDEKSLVEGETMTVHSARAYVTWHRALMSGLARLGLDEAPPPSVRVPTVAEILAEQEREHRA